MSIHMSYAHVCIAYAHIPYTCPSHKANRGIPRRMFIAHVYTHARQSTAKHAQQSKHSKQAQQASTAIKHSK